MGQFHWDPDNYRPLMREEVPDYDVLQEKAAAATGSAARRVLELGTGTGETSARVLSRHPQAVLIGLDSSPEMLDRARSALPAERVELRISRLEDPLPHGPFDVVVSVLAIHHLDGPGKAKLFRQVAHVLAPGGRFVIGDVIVPADPADVVTPIDGAYDLPSTVTEQLGWLEQAGMRAELIWAHRDLAVLRGEKSELPS